eukprot:SAG31_NODE_2754_length_5137_cov_2.875645_5_plen_90_part_00
MDFDEMGARQRPGPAVAAAVEDDDTDELGVGIDGVEVEQVEQVEQIARRPAWMRFDLDPESQDFESSPVPLPGDGALSWGRETRSPMIF